MSKSNPYEANPDNIPSSDHYGDIPLYGRYMPNSSDFTPEPKHTNSSSPESVAYWLSVLEKCTEENRIYDNESGGRDVFALGSVIVKSTHLKDDPGRDYALADANELAATALAKPVMESMDIQVPRIYYADKPCQKLYSVKRSGDAHSTGLAYIVADSDPVTNRGVQELERDILFSPASLQSSQRGLMHNDTSQSNLIVDQGKIVGVVDWEMAGFFGWDVVKAVHLRILSPQRETYAHLNLPKETLDDIYFWNDLYD